METDVTIRINHVGGLWVAQLPTPYGRMELLCGEGDEPDVRTIALIERFFEGPEDHLADIRRAVHALPRLWRPIRFAINNRDQLGVQFRHRLTGKQAGMFFADEHSAFNLKRSDIPEQEADPGRLNSIDQA